MAKLVLGIGTSHTPMLNAPAEDWPRFIDRDEVRDFLDKEGHPSTYHELLQRAEPHVAREHMHALEPEVTPIGHGAVSCGVRAWHTWGAPPPTVLSTPTPRCGACNGLRCGQVDPSAKRRKRHTRT